MIAATCILMLLIPIWTSTPALAKTTIGPNVVLSAKNNGAHRFVITRNYRPSYNTRCQLPFVATTAANFLDAFNARDMVKLVPLLANNFQRFSMPTSDGNSIAVNAMRNVDDPLTPAQSNPITQTIREVESEFKLKPDVGQSWRLVVLHVFEYSSRAKLAFILTLDEGDGVMHRDQGASLEPIYFWGSGTLNCSSGKVLSWNGNASEIKMGVLPYITPESVCPFPPSLRADQFVVCAARNQS
jgi:hypothetical protein